MRFPKQEDWSGLPFLSPGNYPNPGMVPMSPVCQADYHWATWEALILCQRHHQSTSSSEAQCQEPCNSWIGLQRGIWEEQWKEESKGLLQKCLFLAQSHFSRWHRIPGSDVNSVQWQISWFMLKYVTTCWWKLQDLVHGWMYGLEATVWVL